MYSRVELFDFHHFAKSALTQGCQYFDCGKRTEQFIKIKSSREIRENISEFRVLKNLVSNLIGRMMNIFLKVQIIIFFPSLVCVIFSITFDSFATTEILTR